jgi:UDP-N-acetylglucosamine 2-epimerase (non-hydrolysing)
MRVLSIVGTRPEAVKMAPVIQALAENPAVQSRVCVTAQHRQMLDQVLRLFKLTPDYDLDLMRDNQNLAELTADILVHLTPIIRDFEPEWVLAQGDTTTVMAASILAYYHRVKFGHVEAGLRTFDKWQPFPEEVNRRIAGVIADLHFAPTEWARANLLRENVSDQRIVVTGNPVIDALHQIIDHPPDQITRELLAQCEVHNHRRLILVTAHRRENFGLPLEHICSALLRIVNHYGDQIRILYPVHMNPNVQEPVQRILGKNPKIILTEPLDYLPMVHMIKNAAVVLTDSGGLQEEAPGLGVPVLVMREVTERPEGVQAGVVKLVGTDPDRIFAETRILLDDPVAHNRMARAVNPYGDGRAAEKIVNAILHF